MLFLKADPVGIDAPVQKLQSFLHTELSKRWTGTIDGYGRCYRNKTQKGYVPELYVDGTTYKEIVFDADNLSALFFFDAADVTSVRGATSTQRIDVIFQVNLEKIKSARADEAARLDVLKILRAPRFGFRLVDYITGYKNTFARFDGLLSNAESTWQDSHPLHVFKIGLELVHHII